MKKVILLTLAGLVLAVILFFYISFNGNFISKMIAKQKVEKYVEEKYEQQNKQLVDSYYSFKDGQYTFEYAMHYNNTPSTYYVSIGGAFFPVGRIFSYVDYESIDHNVAEKFQRAGIQWLEKKLRERRIDVASVDYYVAVPMGFYEGEVEWQPKLSPVLAPSIGISLTDTEQTEAQFLQQAEQVRQLVNAEEITYADVTIYLTRAFDNSDGAKPGYAETYYEGIYRTTFTPETTELTIR